MAMDLEVTDTAVKNLVDNLDVAFDAEGSRVMTPKLLKEIRSLKSSGKLHMVPQTSLVRFLSLGKDEIHTNSFENLFFASAKSKQQLERGEVSQNCKGLLQTIECAVGMLEMMTADDMPAVVYQEEAIEGILTFVTFHLKNHAFVTLDESYQDGPVAKKLRAAMGKVEAKETMASPKGKGKKKKLDDDDGSPWQYDVLTTFNLLPRLCTIWGQFTKLLQITNLSEEIVHKMVRFSIDSLYIARTSQFQEKCLPLIATVFSKMESGEKHSPRITLVKEIVSAMAKVASLPKKAVASFKIPAGKDIMMVTALLLRIVQECAKPDFSEGVENVSTVATAFEKALQTSKDIVRCVIVRCTDKVDKNMDEKFPKHAENVVEDLCEVLHLPEFPAAALLLEHISGLAVNNLLARADSLPPMRAACVKNGTELAFRKMLVQMCGSIATSIKGPLLTSKSVPASSYVFPLSPMRGDGETVFVSDDDESQKDLSVCELTGLTFSNRLLTQEAARMFGGDVLLDGSWLDRSRNLCLDAHIRVAVQDQISRLQRCAPEDKDDFEANIEREYQLVLMQLFANFFQSTSDDLSHSALCQHVGRWSTHDLADKPELQAFVCKQLKECVTPVHKLVVVLPEEELLSAYSSLVQLHPLFKPQHSDRLLESIASLMRDQNPTLRSKAIAALTKIVNADNSVLMNPKAKQFITAGILDRSASVREKTLDLMGKHMQQIPELITEYYDGICERSQDVSTSVRKRVVTIFKDVLTQWPTCSKSVAMCTELVKCIRDEEESIRNLAQKTLEELWLMSPDEMERRNIDLAIVANQIVEVVDCSQLGRGWVTEMLDAVLNPKEESKKPKSKKKQTPLFAVCANICAQVVADVQRLEQEDAAEEEKMPAVLKRMSTIAMFASVKGSLVAPHIPVLQSWLADNNMGTSVTKQHIVQAVLETIDAGLPTMDKPDKVLLEGIEKSLGVLVVSSGRSLGVLQHSVKCLCRVVNDGTHNYQLAEELLKRQYQMLSRSYETGEIEPAQVHRFMAVAGFFCRYYDYDHPDNAEDHIDQPGLFGDDEAEGGESTLHVGNVSQSVLQLLWKFYTSDDANLRHRALTSMGHVFCRVPKMMTSAPAHKLFTDCLTSKDPRMRAQILKNLGAFLQSEDRAMTMASKNGANDANADSGVASGLVQNFLGHITAACTDDLIGVRMEAANVMQYIVQHRLIGPFYCVPPLVALGCDSEEKCRETAYKLLGVIYDKEPDFVCRKAGEGLKLAYRFLKRSSAPPSLHYGDCEHGIKRLYTLLQSKRERRDGFIDTLMNQLSNFVDGTGDDDDVNFQIFLIEQLAFLPYSFQNEPLRVIYKASEILSLYSGAKIQMLRQLAKPDEYQAASISKTTEAQSVVLLRQVAVCSMLIHLKAYLKDTHMLSDANCESFAPSSRDAAAKEKDKPLAVWNEEKPPELDLTKLGPFLSSEKSEEEFLVLYQLAKDLSEQDLKSDFVLEKKKTKKRKSQTPTPDSTAKKAKTTKKKPKVKRRKIVDTDDEEEDDDHFDDDDWD